MTYQKVIHFVLVVALITAAAQAGVITGSVWHVAGGIAGNAILANVPNRTADVIFTVNSPLVFDAGNSPTTTLAAFLASGGAFDIIENTPATLTSATADILIQFVGVVSVTNGQTFTAGHDDGLTLIIGGVDLGFNPGPTGFVNTTLTYNGPTGTFPFQLVYGECCSGPANLHISLPFENAPGVPEPSTLGLVFTGLAGAAFAYARKRRT